MDCKTVADRLAAWLDGELAPAERQWLEQHIERCPACAERAAALAEQQEALAALAPTPAALQRPDHFWASMDQRLDAELSAMELRATQQARHPPAPPLWRRQHAVGLPAICAYAAALLLLVAFGARQSAALSAAQAQVQRLESDLQRADRLIAQPPPAEPALYRTVSYTPERGHF
ncbi:MAG: zf-HC2 domain-containing protein [Deltaproteobacteria bacterium]|jgi:anti-sigma factor RsiW|nr:zf-HC2 domain-containing protein [Deltaproteobacteria bacterium]